MILVAAVATITFVSAADTVTVEGINFNIPNGYIFNASNFNPMSFKSYEGTGKLAFLQSNDGEDVILIGVVDNPSKISLEDIKNSNSSYTDKKIAGKDGIIADTGKTLNFIYIENNKIVIIFAEQESSIESVII